MTDDLAAILAAKTEIARAAHRGVRVYPLPVAVRAKRVLVELGRGLTARVRAHELRARRERAS
ncbi:MAG: hypothetical protein ACYC4P_07210 [Thermoanaerobaculia bacterium]